MKIGTQDWPRIIPTEDSILDEIDMFDFENNLADSTIEKIDGHRAMNVLKVATALSVLDGRANVTQGAWDLAKHVMPRSDAVDRTSGGWGTCGSGRVDTGGRRSLKK